MQPEPRHAEDEVVGDGGDVEAKRFLVGHGVEEDEVVFGDGSSSRRGPIG